MTKNRTKYIFKYQRKNIDLKELILENSVVLSSDDSVKDKTINYKLYFIISDCKNRY